MVVVVFRPEAGHIVVDVAGREVGFKFRSAHCFKEQKGSSSCCILCKCLVDADTNLPVWSDFAVSQMSGEYFVDKRFSQVQTPSG